MGVLDCVTAWVGRIDLPTPTKTPHTLIHQQHTNTYTHPKKTQTEIIPEDIARLPLPPGTSYRCLSEDVVRGSRIYTYICMYSYIGMGTAATKKKHDTHTPTPITPPKKKQDDDDPIHAMVPNVSIGSMSLSAAHSFMHHGSGSLPRVPSTVKEESEVSLAGAKEGENVEDDGHIEYRMVRTATNTIEAETPCHRHHHHHHHHHAKPAGQNRSRTFNDLFSPLEAERAARAGLEEGAPAATAATTTTSTTTAGGESR